MRKFRILLVFAALTAGVLTAASQPPGGKDKDPDKKGPPPFGKKKGFEPGRVLPPFVRDALELTEDQERKIEELEKDVKARLKKILTAEQWEKLSEFRFKGPKGPKGDKKGPPPDDFKDDKKPPKKDKDRPKKDDDKDKEASRSGIQWFATWDSGLREARRSGRPILLVSAAPHCAGVSGTW